MWKLKPFPNQIHQAVFDALKKFNFEYLKELDAYGFDWYELPFYVNGILDLYHSSYSINFLQGDFIETVQFFLKKDICSANNVFYVELYNVLEKLMYACGEPGDIKYVQEYLSAGHDAHRYDSEYLFSAIFSKRFDIAEILIKNGAQLQNWPYLLYWMISTEFEEYVYEHIDGKNEAYHLDAERVCFMLQNQVQINTFSQIHTNALTALDLAKQHGHWAVYEVLRAHGAKHASEML